MQAAYVLSAFSLILVQAPALANNAPAGATKSAQKTLDPNEVICKVSEGTGSRLKKTKICRTRAEFEAERADNRRQVDRAQSAKTTNY
jgi:hypothetical protein